LNQPLHPVGDLENDEVPMTRHAVRQRPDEVGLSKNEGRTKPEWRNESGIAR